MLVEDRVINFEKLGLGLFIHWGLYSYFGKGEWSQNILNIDNYNESFKKFNPNKENIKKLVTMAKKSGFGYIVLTVKHHEGFCMFDTQGITEFDSTHTPFKDDVVRVFVDECHKQKISPFLYFATYDWHNPKYNNDFKAYLSELRSLIKVLGTSYGKIGGFWFDGNWDKPDADWEINQLYGQIRQLQPDAMIVNNTGLERQGISSGEDVDVITFERGNPENIRHKQGGRYLAAETSMTLNKHWGYAENDISFVSSKYVIEQICNSRKVGANLLINIGPHSDGSIDIQSQALLDIVNRWMDINGQAIYQTNNYSNLTYNANDTNDFIKGEYLFVTDLGNVGNSNVVLGGENAKKIIFNDFSNKRIKKIKWLDNNCDVNFEQNLTTHSLTIFADGFEYGTYLVERVAKLVY